MRRLLFLLFFTFSPLVVSSLEAQAESQLLARPPQFEVGTEVQNRIDFWKLVFTRYGKDQLVFHHREHPHIIYSVLDLTEFNQTYSGKELARLTNRAIDDEIARIQSSLNRLADEGAPRTPAERRLYHLFEALPGSTRSQLRAATEIESIRNQKGIRELFREGVIRSGRYLHAMESVFASEGLPVEITRLPLVESSFNYNAYSSVGAAGIWQFMRATGKKYLRVDATIDERRDPIMATRAAARYLGDAYNRLGSWPLAITSYNHGVTGVLRAVNQTGSKDLGKIIQNYDGESFGFASKNFYAEFMAALEVEQHAERYFPGIRREDPWHFDEVRLSRSIGYRDLIRISGGDEEEVEKLNRALMTPITSGRAKIPAGFVVRVPNGRGRALIASVGGDMIRREEVNGVLRAEKRQKGASEIQTVQGSGVEETRVSSRNAEPTSDASAFVGRSYVVKKGDTLGSIARRFSVPASSIQSANGLSGSSLRVGTKILIPSTKAKPSEAEEARASGENSEQATKSGAAQAESTGRTMYKVSKGDTIGGIATRFGVSTSELTRANPGLKPKSLRAGRTLVIPAGRPGTTAAVEGEAKGRIYTVQSGDTLFRISRKLGVSVEQLIKLNPGAEKGIKPGQGLLTAIQ